MSAAPATFERRKGFSIALLGNQSYESVEYAELDPDALAVSTADVNARHLGAWLSDLARLVMQLVIVLAVAEITVRHRMISDAWLAALFIMAFGWWITVRMLRQSAAEVLKPSASW